VGYTSYVWSLPAGGRAPFEVDEYGQVPTYTSIEAYAQPWLE
jgi:hypothetical protein